MLLGMEVAIYHVDGCFHPWSDLGWSIAMLLTSASPITSLWAIVEGVLRGPSDCHLCVSTPGNALIVL